MGCQDPDVHFLVETPVMISRTAEYVLRAVVVMGSKPQCPRTTQQILQQTRVPSGCLAKVLQGLSRNGLVASHRGLNGGFVLSRPLEELTILEVSSAVDPLKRIERCPLGLAVPGNRLHKENNILFLKGAALESALTSAKA
jgi:Rrf2 family protein